MGSGGKGPEAGGNSQRCPGVSYRGYSLWLHRREAPGCRPEAVWQWQAGGHQCPANPGPPHRRGGLRDRYPEGGWGGLSGLLPDERYAGGPGGGPGGYAGAQLALISPLPGGEGGPGLPGSLLCPGLEDSPGGGALWPSGHRPFPVCLPGLPAGGGAGGGPGPPALGPEWSGGALHFRPRRGVSGSLPAPGQRLPPPLRHGEEAGGKGRKKGVSRIAVIGTTTWGTTLAIRLAQGGARVKLLARTEEEAGELQARRQSPP